MTENTQALPLGLTREDRVLLFDGVCNLCQGSVQFFIKRDRLGRIRYASLQSEPGQQLLKHFGLPTEDFDSVVFVEDGKAYLRSAAAIRAARQLPGIWSLASVLLIIPRFLRDLGYKLIAANRYRLFGKQESCMMPTPELRARFLDQATPQSQG